MRSSIATRYRGTFTNLPGTMLATNDDVHAHKQEMVDTAVRLAVAGHEDQALAWLMRVHQMPDLDMIGDDWSNVSVERRSHSYGPRHLSQRR